MAGSDPFLDLGKDSAADLHVPEGTEREVALLRSENAKLRNRLAEADELLQAAANSEEAWLEKQKEYELLLEEKSEVIRGMHLKVHELLEGGNAPAPLEGKASAHLGADLEDRRRQLEEDENALMAQMRDMEMALSRDRAELARQRNEIQRLHADLTREIEMAARDPVLRERLAGLQRRHQDVMTNRGGAASHPVHHEPTPAPKAEAAPKKNSGLLRRLFGGGTE